VLGTSIGANTAVSANNPCAANPTWSRASVVVPACVVVVDVDDALASARDVSRDAVQFRVSLAPIRARSARALARPARRMMLVPRARMRTHERARRRPSFGASRVPEESSTLARARVTIFNRLGSRRTIRLERDGRTRDGRR
jgi:hypothetical protein